MLKVTFGDFSPETQKQITCLSDNIFFESAYESEIGKRAVAFVTLNRVQSSKYPDQICDVVKQKNTNTCQFSWYCEDKAKRLSYTKNLTNNQQMVYNHIRDIAIHVYLNYDSIEDPTKGSLFYHADYVDPYWSKHMTKTVQIGRHIFYTKKGMI
jgi:spore germination cell wall hydrolase CwlJ-like protein